MSNRDYDRNIPVKKTNVPVRVHRIGSVRCDGCGKDLSDMREYLDHIYENDECYNHGLASDRDE